VDSDPYWIRIQQFCGSGSRLRKNAGSRSVFGLNQSGSTTLPFFLFSYCQTMIMYKNKYFSNLLFLFIFYEYAFCAAENHCTFLDFQLTQYYTFLTILGTECFFMQKKSSCLKNAFCSVHFCFILTISFCLN
jgi:hypothetical protein